MVEESGAQPPSAVFGEAHGYLQGNVSTRAIKTKREARMCNFSGCSLRNFTTIRTVCTRGTSLGAQYRNVFTSGCKSKVPPWVSNVPSIYAKHNKESSCSPLESCCPASRFTTA